MAEAQSQFFGLIRGLTPQRKLALLVVLVASIATIVGLVKLFNRPTYGTLFNNLNTQDASKIVEKLREKGVPYVLESGGRSVLVPKEQVYDLRLSLAGEGLPQSSVIGYEIFDRTNLGVSDFVQKVNYRRALEGELARTILQLDEVEAARVHIVVPEKTLFRDDEKPATASVVLKLRTGKPLKKDAIQGIGHLVSSSVEGLQAHDVSILDSRGVLLSDNTKANSISSLTASQYELQQSVETYFSQKVQRLLEGVVGPENALVQVNADLDLRQIERTLEQYDPENTAVRSEQTTEEKSSISDTLPPSVRSNSITNYEVNKTIEHIVERGGNLKRLSVAVLVNGTQQVREVDGERTMEYSPRTDEEMERLTDLVKKAVGYTPERKDEVSVVNLPFGRTIDEKEFVYKPSTFPDWKEIAEKVFLVLAMLAAIFILRSLLNRLKVGFVGTGERVLGSPPIGELTSRRFSVPLPSPEEEITEDAIFRNEKRKRTAEYISKKPEDASRLIKVWLAEE